MTSGLPLDHRGGQGERGSVVHGDKWASPGSSDTDNGVKCLSQHFSRLTINDKGA